MKPKLQFKLGCIILLMSIATNTLSAQTSQTKNLLCDQICELSVTLNDSYGDGWNNAYIVVEQDGVILDSITLSDGYSTQECVTVCANKSTNFGAPAIFRG